MTLTKINTIQSSLPVSVLREVVNYEAETGEFTWRKRPAWHFPEGKPTPEARAGMWNGKYAGRKAFTSLDPRGYARGAVGGKTLYAHRAALAILNGHWPDGEVDHINGDKSDNRAVNLRVVSHSENRRNTENYRNAQVRRMAQALQAESRKTAYPIPGVRRQGVSTWAARIKIGGVEKHLGSFRCFGRAVLARKEAQT